MLLFALFFRPIAFPFPLAPLEQRLLRMQRCGNVLHLQMLQVTGTPLAVGTFGCFEDNFQRSG